MEIAIDVIEQAVEPAPSGGSGVIPPPKNQ
jgi:hypothetical protein